MTLILILYLYIVLNDGGANFTNAIVNYYDTCDITNKIVYLNEGKNVLAASLYSKYISKIFREIVNKLDNVHFWKTKWESELVYRSTIEWKSLN